jgi:hypothetical protein
MRNASLSIVLSLSLIIVIGACGVSQRTLDNAQKRIDALKLKGVPDSSLSTAIVYLFQAKDSDQRGNKGLARRSADSMRILIAQAEAAYQDNLIKKKPEIDDLILQLTRAKTQLTGLQLKKLDSAMSVIDSFNQKNWIYQTEYNAKLTFNELLPVLKFNEERAGELRSRLPGEWVCTNISKNTENKEVHTVEKKIFTFTDDGKCKLVENKIGQSSPVLKEDWEFVSSGTYDFLGDTIVMFIDHFARARQNIDTVDAAIFKERKKKVWGRKAEPAYDSAITDGSQDRWIPFIDLQRDFVKRG